MFTKLFLLSATLGLFAAQAAIIDNFDRADALTLGANWTVASGGAQILGNRAAGTSDASLALFDGLSSSTASVDIYTVGTDTQYIALVTNYQNSDDNYFIKVQSQSDDGMFSHYGFYYGNNGGGLFGSLSAPFSSARIIVTVLGQTANLDIDTDFDGTADQSYSYNYAIATGGTGVGLGFYGAAQADNFGTDAGTLSQVPEPGTLLLTLAGLTAAGLWRRRTARS